MVGIEDVDGPDAPGPQLGATELPATDLAGPSAAVATCWSPDGNVFGLISPVLYDGTVAMGGGAEA